MTEHKHGPVRWQEILGQTRYEELGICSCGQVIEVAERILDFCGTWHRKVKGEWRDPMGWEKKHLISLRA